MQLIFFVLSIIFIYPNEDDSYTFTTKYSIDDGIIKYNKPNTLTTPGLVAGDSNAVDTFLKLL